jgi:WD40 repeat protein
LARGAMLLRSLVLREMGGASPASSAGGAPSARPPVGPSMFEACGPFERPRSRLGERAVHGLLVPTLRNTWQYEADQQNLPTALRVAPGGRGGLLAMSDEGGNVVVLKVPQQPPERGGPELLAPLKVLLAHRTAVFDFCWLGGDDTRVVTAAGDRTLRVVDVEHDKIVLTMGKHSSSVRCVRAFNRSEHLLVSCCRGGVVCLWDVRSPRRTMHFMLNGPDEPLMDAELSMQGVHSFPCSSSNSGGCGTTCVAPTRDDTLIATAGASDGLVKFWDVRRVEGGGGEHAAQWSRGAKPVRTIGATRGARCQKASPGISRITFDPEGGKLAVNYLKGALAVYDWQSFGAAGDEHAWRAYAADADRLGGGSVRFLSGSRDAPYDPKTYYVESCFSPCGNFLVAGSGRCAALIWDVYGANQEPLATLNGHTREVCSLHWDPNNVGRVVTTGDDAVLCVWETDLKRANRLRDAELAARPAAEEGLRPQHGPLTFLLHQQNQQQQHHHAPHHEPQRRQLRPQQHLKGHDGAARRPLALITPRAAQLQLRGAHLRMRTVHLELRAAHLQLQAALPQTAQVLDANPQVVKVTEPAKPLRTLLDFWRPRDEPPEPATKRVCARRP